MAEAICSLPLEYAPWTRSLYSDLGFMLLGFLLEDAGHARLDRQFAPVAADLELCFGVPAEWRERTAPTEHDPWRGRLLAGEVHDENAWALGGVAGHAGLVRHGAGRWRVRTPRAGHLPAGHGSRTTRDAGAVHGADDRTAQLARGWLGHDAADIVVRHTSVGVRGGPHRLHRNVALDRSRARSLRGVADQPRAPVAGQPAPHGAAAPPARCRGGGIRVRRYRRAPVPGRDAPVGPLPGVPLPGVREPAGRCPGCRGFVPPGCGACGFGLYGTYTNSH